MNLKRIMIETNQLNVFIEEVLASFLEKGHKKKNKLYLNVYLTPEENGDLFDYFKRTEKFIEFEKLMDAKYMIDSYVRVEPYDEIIEILFVTYDNNPKIAPKVKEKEEQINGVDMRLWNEVLLPSMTYSLVSEVTEAHEKENIYAIVLSKDLESSIKLAFIYKHKFGGELKFRKSDVSLSCENGDTYFFIGKYDVSCGIRGMRFNQIILAK